MHCFLQFEEEGQSLAEGIGCRSRRITPTGS